MSEATIINEKPLIVKSVIKPSKTDLDAKFSDLVAETEGEEEEVIDDKELWTGRQVNSIINVLNQAPESYRMFGVCWWAVKRVLKKHSDNIPDEMEKDMADKYSYDDDFYTLFAGMLDYEVNNSKTFISNRKFAIKTLIEGEESEVDYVLFDSDFEP